MRKPGLYNFLFIALTLTLCTALPAVESANTSPTNTKASITVHSECVAQSAFGKDCEKLLIKELDKAEKEVLIAIYSITRKNIAAALLRAKKRDVAVTVKYDKNSYDWQGMKTTIGWMRKRGVPCIPVTLTGKYAKMHHKFAVIDRKRVITGSYNYTTSASTVNYENLLLIESPVIAKKYALEFENIKDR